VVPLATARAPEYDEEFVVNLLGSVEVAALEPMKCVHGPERLWMARAFVQVRHDDLTLGASTFCSCVMRKRLENRGPRRLYPG